jgi:activator of HSP90 ATPase
METKTIKQKITFKANPKKVYDLLMDPKKHAEFTGGKVKMSQKPKGKFEVFGGYCTGYNVALDPGKIIIQAWNFKEEGWPATHYSGCTFEFFKVPGGTELHFLQEAVPAHKAEDLKKGWKKYYWNPMKKMLK